MGASRVRAFRARRDIVVRRLSSSKNTESTREGAFFCLFSMQATPECPCHEELPRPPDLIAALEPGAATDPGSASPDVDA